MNGSAQEKLRVLILDDHAGVRRGVRQILTEGFQALEFDEGKAGIESLDLALSQPWDLVIVSVDVPDREGLTMLTECEAAAPWPADTRTGTLPRGSLCGSEHSRRNGRSSPSTHRRWNERPIHRGDGGFV